MVVSKHYVQLPLLKNRDKKCAIVCVLGLRESEDALTMYCLHLHQTREDAHLISTMLPNLFSNHLFYFLAPLSYVCSSLPLVQGLLVYIRRLLQNNVLVFFFFWTQTYADKVQVFHLLFPMHQHNKSLENAGQFCGDKDLWNCMEFLSLVQRLELPPSFSVFVPSIYFMFSLCCQM